MKDDLKILIVDDHPVVRQGLSTMIDLKPGLKVIGEASNGMEAIKQADSLKPDVILMDLVMPQMDGIEATQKIKNQNPHTRILVLTSFTEDEKVIAAIRAGASGYVLKDSSPQTLLQAIYNVYEGKSPLDPVVAGKLISGLQPVNDSHSFKENLTEREIEVLKYIAQGISNKDIAVKLSITDGTVHFHVSNILKKLNLQNRTQAAMFALREGLVNLDEEE